ncbi:MAG TPA: hypothetical protein VMM56_12055, partial [Planctomycetaceae bacterium]|nr:hypothetical protein [Planctomycetaceae bacterium]
MDHLDRLSILKNRAPEIADRIELISSEELTILDELDCAVFFVMAYWSGPSVQMFSELGSVLSSVDPDNSIRLIVVDIDEIGHLVRNPPFCDVAMGGNGETFWIEHGQVISNSGGGLNFECIRLNTEQLLE